MKITCNLYAQWIDGIRKEMTQAGFDHYALSDQDCAIKFYSWKRRIVPSRKRHVFKASDFNCPNHLKKGLTNLEKAFETGNDIWPWQSKFIDRPSYEDGMFNDYRVVHFHLGIGFKPNGYINRTPNGELLFAIVDSSSVYELGIYRHGDWYELDLLDIVDDNWPHLLDAVTIRVLDITHCPSTREEVKTLRKANVVSFIKLKSGRIVAPLGGGVATNGTSNDAVCSADYWAKVLRDGEKAIISDIKEQIQKGELESKDYEILLHATDDEVAGVLPEIHKWILWKKT